MPAGSAVEVRASADAVVVPVPGLRVGDERADVFIEVLDSWRPWLLRAFAEALGYLDDASCRGLLQGLLDDAVGSSPNISFPPTPTTPELAALVAVFVRSPAIPLLEIARRRLSGWSPRTVQRRFLSETGLSPGQWARRARIALAADLLRDGGEVEAVAHATGYETVSGFSRAFRDAVGVAPARWRERSSALADERVVADASSVETLPSHRTWPRVNGSHVAVWVVFGTAQASLGDRLLPLRAGQAIVLPAGVPNGIRIARGSLVLPVGYVSGRSIAVGGPVAACDIPAEDVGDMIRAVVAAYTTIRAAGTDPTAGFERVLDGSVRAPADAAVSALGAVASALAVGDIAEPGLADCAQWLGMPERGLSRIINAQTGATFAQWVRMSRMSRARVQLSGGGDGCIDRLPRTGIRASARVLPGVPRSARRIAERRRSDARCRGRGRPLAGEHPARPARRALNPSPVVAVSPPGGIRPRTRPPAHGGGS
ncbi:helix-turn-helix domain-containing protein [uncultured Microbacterium sp.]|uniref:helix-turn-helix domain-containing protein n=1 Tax=uncultured Microbacterium sp. TaxID=191216 RepID=UPI00261D35D3|nr:helix-turn-helix domain-containing protein [uncultured Microbacterium sp.]